MTHQDEFDFTQFKGKFDSAMSPDSDFSERMKQMLAGESRSDSLQHKTTVIASPSKPGSVVPTPGRRSHPLTIAASILVVLSVVVSSIWVLGDFSLEGEYASAPSGIATLPADVEMTPGADVQLSKELVIPFDFTSYSNVYTLAVLDGVIYTSHDGPVTGSSLDHHASFVTAWDAESGEQIWQIEGYSLWNLELEDGVLVAYRSTFPTADGGQVGEEIWPTTSIMALDSSTGEPLWEKELDETEVQRIWDSDLVTIADLAIVLQPEGTVLGLDVHTGEQVWKSTFDPGQGWPTEIQRGATTISTNMYSFAMSEWNGQIAIANSDGVVQIIDSSNGEILTSHQVSGKSSPGYLSLNALPDGLLLTHGGESYQMMAFNPDSGDVLWEREFDGDITVEVSENGMIAVNSHIWESGSIIMRLIGRGGHSTHQFLWIDGETGADLISTERGRNDNPVFVLTNDDYLCARSVEFICYDQAGTRHILADGPWATAYFSDDMLYFDRDDGVYRVALP